MWPDPSKQAQPLRLFLDATEHSLKLNEVIYASTISACEKASEWSCAVKLFQAPGRRGGFLGDSPAIPAGRLVVFLCVGEIDLE